MYAQYVQLRCIESTLYLNTRRKDAADSAPNSESCSLNISSVLRPILIYGRGAAANFSPKSAGGESGKIIYKIFFQLGAFQPAPTSERK